MPDRPIVLTLDAMATRFELVLHGSAAAERLRSAGEDALQEIERVDGRLSIYRSDSEMCRLNARAADGPVKTDPRTFRLLQRCAELSALTDGAFDITIAPLMRAWGFTGAGGHMPDPKDIEKALEVVGMRHVRFDSEGFTIGFDTKGVMLDLGAVGKGYAVEKAVEILREHGVENALIHGGTSTVYGIGVQPDGRPWKIAIQHPTKADRHLDVVELRDSSMSVSAVHGKSFTRDGIEYGHVIDPRTGQPIRGGGLAAVIGPSPTDCDALSTALLVLGDPGLIAERFPGCRGIVADGGSAGEKMPV